MKIGIIIHSMTGNTNSVGQKLKDKFLLAKHIVSVEKVEAENDEQAEIAKIKFISSPDISSFDAIVFGAPVRAFSLSPVMSAYLNRLGTLEGKKTACFVTQQFPFPWMGGNRAIKQMSALIDAKGGKPMGSGIINWSSKERDRRIEDVVRSLVALF